MEGLLELLHENAELSEKQIASILNKTEDDVKEAINNYKQAGIIKGYKALINWDLAPVRSISAIIQLRVTPQPDTGFDSIARSIMVFDEVESVYLMAGSYDFSIMVRAESIQEISEFVAKKLSTLDNVISTATHFVLTRYKDSGILLAEDEKQEERRTMMF